MPNGYSYNCDIICDHFSSVYPLSMQLSYRFDIQLQNDI